MTKDTYLKKQKRRRNHHASEDGESVERDGRLRLHWRLSDACLFRGASFNNWRPCECLGFAVVLTLLPCDAFTDQAAGLHGPEQRAARQAR